MIVEFLSVFVTIIIAVLTYYQFSYSYWKRRNVPYVQPRFPLGFMEYPFKKDKKQIAERFRNVYNEFKAKNCKYCGYYMMRTPRLLLYDPDCIKNVIVRDFPYFTDRLAPVDDKRDPLSGHLFLLGGDRWRQLRAKLTPTFTSGKMKMMFPTLVDCGANLVEATAKFSKSGQSMDMKDMLGKFTLDVIGSCAFGLDCNSFEDPNTPFRRHTESSLQIRTVLDAVREMLQVGFPSLVKYMPLSSVRVANRQFFVDIVAETVNYREKNQIQRNDFLQLLIDLKNAQDGTTLTINEMAAQAFVFFVAGFDTSSTTMSFCLYELSLNPDIQNKVRAEISTVLKDHRDQLTYEAINDMKYLGQVVDETLRMYPAALTIFRRCVKDYQLPDTDLLIEKGIGISIPVLALHHDKEHFADPERFDPERFSPENREKIRPCSYLPFGDGPRNCIGSRFGLMQVKVGLVLLLRNYKFSISKKMKLPVELDPRSFLLAAKDGIWLDVMNVN